MVTDSAPLVASALRTPLLLLARACLPACSDDGGTSGGGQIPDGPSGTSLDGTLFATRGRSSEAFGLVFAISPSTGAVAVASNEREETRDEGRYTPAAEFLVIGSVSSSQTMYGVNDCVQARPQGGFNSRDETARRVPPNAS